MLLKPRVLATLLSIAFCFSYSPRSMGNHLVGGDLTYECLAPGEYRLTFTLFKDCLSNVALVNEQGSVYNQGTLDLAIDSIDFVISPADIASIPPDTDNICPETIPEVCLERGIYQVDLSLPNTPDGYLIALQRCCRNNTILNIEAPGSVGTTFVAEIPGSDDPNECVNSSPTFTSTPPQIICANSAFLFDNAAFDPDGDNLVFELCSPYAGATATNSNPNPCPPPPYEEVPWIPGFDSNNQIPSDPPMSIDPNTGELFLFPTTVGQYVVGICVSEYRDGELLSTVRRDFQFNVTECQSLAPGIGTSTVAGDLEFFQNDTVVGCAPLTVSFVNATSGADSYLWEFGNGAPSSAEENPETPIIYTDTGLYEVRMIAEDEGCNLSDTLNLVVEVLEPDVISADMEVQLPAVCTDLDFSFLNQSSTPAGIDYTYTWDFGDGNQTNQENPSNSYILPGAYDVFLAITGPAPCYTTDTVRQSINVGGTDVVADFSIPSIVCAPFELDLLSNNPALNYSWQTGDGTQLNGVAVTHTYTQEGSYDVQLLVTDPAACNQADSLSQTLLVYDTPAAAFTVSSVSPEIFAPVMLSTDITDTENFTFSWDLGDGNTSDLPNPDVAYADIGEKQICLTLALNDTDCEDTQCQTISVTSDVAIDIPSAFSPNGDGVNDMLMIRGKGFGTVDLKIFDRFGKEVFATTDPAIGWDGAIDEQYQEMDVFVYVLKAVMYDGTVIDKSGNITMLK